MGDDGLDNLMERESHTQMMDYSYRGSQMNYQNDDDSIAKSYNQKVKNDTNYLAKSKAMYEDSQTKDYESYQYKKE